MHRHTYILIQTDWDSYLWNAFSLYSMDAAHSNAAWHSDEYSPRLTFQAVAWLLLRRAGNDSLTGRAEPKHQNTVGPSNWQGWPELMTILAHMAWLASPVTAAW